MRAQRKSRWFLTHCLLKEESLCCQVVRILYSTTLVDDNMLRCINGYPGAIQDRKFDRAIAPGSYVFITQLL